MLRLSPILAVFTNLVIAAAVPWCAQAQATEFPAEGWPGSWQRPAVCADGSYLVGFRARTGSWIDAIGPICAPLLADGRLGKQKRLALHGGNGGDTKSEWVCTDDRIVYATRIVLWGDVKSVYQVDFACYSVVTGQYGQEVFTIKPKGGETTMATIGKPARGVSSAAG